MRKIYYDYEFIHFAASNSTTRVTPILQAVKFFFNDNKKDKKVIVCHFPMIFAQWKRMYKEHFTEGWNIVICQTFEADHASQNYFTQQRGWLKNKIIGYIIFRGWKTISTKGIGNVHALRQQVWHISNSFVLSGVDVNTSYMCVTSITHVHNDITNVIFNHIFIFLLISIFVVE